MEPTPASSKSRRLGQLLEEQSGVVARWQVAPVEWSEARRRVRCGVWQLPIRGVAVAHNGSLGPEQLEWVGLLSVGPEAALCGLTAAGKFGLRGFAVDGVHVLASYRRSSVVPRFVRLHRTRASFADDVHPVLRPRRVRAEIAVAQGAIWAPSSRYGCAILAASAQQRIVRVDAVRSAVLRQPQVRGRQLLLQVLDDISGGAQALTEIDATRLCRKAGLPMPSH